MSAETPRSVSGSIRAYHQLLRVYPKEFQARFGEPLLQAFGDLARRALSRGGTLQLVLLWMRMLPDLGISAVREHASGARWLHVRSLRLRWVIACACGFALGSAAGDQLGAVMEPPYSGWARSLCIGLALGFLQSWALRRRGAVVAGWTAATALGLFVLASPFSFAFGGAVNRLSMPNQIVVNLLVGAGIGLLQFLILRKTTARAWQWIPVNAAAVLGSWIVSLVFNLAVYSSASPPFGFVPGYLLTGFVFGCLTGFPLATMLGPGEERGIEGAVHS